MNASDPRGAAYRAVFETPEPSRSQEGGVAQAGDWVSRGFDAAQGMAVESARRLARMRPEEIARLRRSLGPQQKIFGWTAAALDGLERYLRHEPLDEVALRELARVGLSTALAEIGATAGGSAGALAGGGYADWATVPLFAGGGAIAGGVAGDAIGNLAGDIYAGGKHLGARAAERLGKLRQDAARSIREGVDSVEGRHNPANHVYDEQGRRLY
jgi:hypothetical protein